MAQQKITSFPVATKGLYTSAASDGLGPDVSPWCQNIRFRFGEIMRTPGRSIVLDTQAQPILDFFSYASSTGSNGLGSLEAAGANNWMASFDPVNKLLAPEVALAPMWSGAPQSRFSWSGGEDRTFVVRNSKVSAINRDTGGTWTVEQLDSPAGRFVEYFANRVFLMNLNGAQMRVQWSKRAQYTDWAETTGHGGWMDLFDGYTEPLMGGRVLNDRLVIYRNSSITEMVQMGDDITPFLPQGRVYGIGCMAPFTLQSVGQFHIFLANDFNVYIWDGIQLKPIGSPIHNYLRQILDTSKLDYAVDAVFSATFMGFKEYWLVLPTTVSGEGTVILIYDYLRDTWTRDVLPGTTAAYNTMQRGPVGTAGYSEVGYPINYPNMMMAKGNQFFMIDERIDGDRLNRPGDGGIEMFVDTPDMYYDPTRLQNHTLQRTMISQNPTGVGTPYQFEVSIDRGQTFPISYTTTPIPEHWGFEFQDINITSNVRRYRLRCPAAVGAGKTRWRAYTEVYVPSGEFFSVERPVGATLSVPSTNPDPRET
jgi:hypothetical protein